MEFKEGTISQIWDVNGTRALAILNKFASMSILAREQPQLLPNHPFFQVTSKGAFLAALRSVNTDLIVVFLKKRMLRWVAARETRARAFILRVPVIIVCEEPDVNWPDDVESRSSIDNDGQTRETSMFKHLFKEPAI